MEHGGVAIPIIVVTLFWGIIGAGLPWIIPKGPNRGKTVNYNQTIKTLNGIHISV